MNFLRQQVVSPAVIALGSNLGIRDENIRRAVAAIDAVDGVSVSAVSGLVESFAVKPQGVDVASPNYLNAVILVDTTLQPEELLAALHAIETAQGRVRVERWGDRTLDLDIVSFGALERHSAELTLPHPRAFERPFVVVPWLQADPAAWLVGHGRVDQLAAAIAPDAPLTPYVWHYEASPLFPSFVAPKSERHTE